MVAITFAGAGAWGAGKGSPLVKSEVDGNFWNLKQALEDLQNNPLQPLEIYDISVVGNQMTITLSDLYTVLGPFTLPVAVFNWTDAFQGSHAYGIYDFFTAEDGLYMVLQAHTSDPTFDANASNVNGPLYYFLMPFPKAYDFGFFLPGKPGTGITDGKPIFGHIPVRDIVLPLNLADAVAYLEDAPTSALSFDIVINSATVGSLDFGAGEHDGVFTFDAAQGMTARSDRIKFMKPSAIDATAENLYVTIKASLGTISDS